MSCCGGTVVQSTKGPQGPPGSCTPLVEILYADLLALKNASSLVPATIYHIIDRGIYVQALTTNGLETEATLRATNADYNNVTTNFIGVWRGTTTLEINTVVGGFTNGELVTGGTSGAIGEITIWWGNNPSTFFGMNIISKNGTAFQIGEVITGASSAAHAVVVSVTTTAILGSIALNKIVAWNNLHYVNITGSGSIQHPKYDTTNWTLLPTTDISYQIEYDNIVYNFESDIITSRRDKRGNIVVNKDSYPNSITKFQWGNNSVFSNEIFSFGFEGWNAATPYQQVFLQDGSLYVGDTANINFLNSRGRSTCIFIGASDCQAIEIHHSNVAMTGGLCRHSYIYDFVDLTVVGGSANAGDNTFFGCYLIVRGTSNISTCYLDNGASGSTITFTNENHGSQYFKRNVSSTFVKALTQDNGLTTLTLDSSGIYGVYNITITGGVASIDTIVNMPSVMSVQINPITTNAITFVNGGAGSLQLKGGTNKTFYPANADWIIFQTITSVIQELNSSIGSSVPVANTLFVSKSGNDTTGTVGIFNKPYLTITAAQTAASSGQTIVVYPGTYIESGLGKSGLNYHFVNGAIISSASSIMWVDTAAISYSITGDGEFTSTSGSIVQFAAGGVLSMVAKKVSSTTALMFFIGSTSKVYLTIEQSVVASSTGTCFDVFGSGELYVKTSLVSSAGYAAKGNSGTSKLYITADNINSSGTSLFDLCGIVEIRGLMTYTGVGTALGSGTGNNCSQDYYGDIIHATSALAMNYSANNTGTINFYGKIIGTGNILIGSTTITYTFYNEISTNLSTTPSISQATGSTVKILSKVTNLDVNAASYGITKTDGTLILQNAIIVTSGGTESIHSVAPQNIKVIGSLSSNVTKSVNITDLCGGILQVDTDIS